MKIGKYEVFELVLSYFKLDGGAMFGVVPKTLWEKENFADDHNRVKLACRSLLLKSQGKNILIDAGLNLNWNEKFKKIYSPEFVYQNSIDELLEKYNLNSDLITDVILTHLHFDHCGGCAVYSNGKYEPTFKYAKHHIQKTAFDWALNPCEKDRASFVRDYFFPLISNNQFVFHYGEFVFDENIKIFSLNGHTFGMQAALIEDENYKLFYSSDLFPMKSNFYLPYISAFDLQPLETLKEKKFFLEQAVANNWILILNHEPSNCAIKPNRNEKGYNIETAFEKLGDI